MTRNVGARHQDQVSRAETHPLAAAGGHHLVAFGQIRQHDEPRRQRKPKQTNLQSSSKHRLVRLQQQVNNTWRSPGCIGETPEPQIRGLGCRHLPPFHPQPFKTELTLSFSCRFVGFSPHRAESRLKRQVVRIELEKPDRSCTILPKFRTFTARLQRVISYPMNTPVAEGAPAQLQPGKRPVCSPLGAGQKFYLLAAYSRCAGLGDTNGDAAALVRSSQPAPANSGQGGPH